MPHTRRHPRYAARPHPADTARGAIIYDYEQGCTLVEDVSPRSAIEAVEFLNTHYPDAPPGLLEALIAFRFHGACNACSS